MAETWKVQARGGPYDGFEAVHDDVPREVLIVWDCGVCPIPHGTFDADLPTIVMKTAEPYRRVLIDFELHVATYEPASFPGGPSAFEEALAGMGAAMSMWDRHTNGATT